MTLTELIFFFFIGLTVLPALLILFTGNVLYAAFFLLLTFLGVAGIYIFAQSDFLAITQIMIYVGGVLILILFGIMLTNRVAGQKYLISGTRNRLPATVLGIALFVLLFFGILKTNFGALHWIRNGDTAAAPTTVEKIGENLMTRFVLPFETAALLLLAALIGAAFVAGQVVKNRQGNR